MHIPDGFLDTKVIITTSLISGGYFFYALRQIHRKLDDRMIPVMSVLSAFIFAAQMINFPIPGGTSGHLLGGGLATFLVGPVNAFFVISIVLIIQCFFFADGGITALGANVFNMAIVGVWISFLVFRMLKLVLKKEQISMGIASGLAVVISSMFAALQLWASKTVPSFLVVFFAMATWHILIGVGEGVITASAITLIKKWLPELMENKNS